MSSGNELFASEASSSDLLAKPLVLSVVVRNLRPALLRNVVMDGSDVGRSVEEARGVLAVVRFDKAAVRVLPVSGRREIARVS